MRHYAVGVVCYAICWGHMLYLYLDESGDLGFDFVNKRPSKYFTVCVMAVKGQENDRAVAKAVRAVLRSRKVPKAAGPAELKGSLVPLDVKKYFFRKVRSAAFSLHAVTLDKMGLCSGFIVGKDRIYNYVSRLALEKVDFKDAAVRVIMTVDKSKPRLGIVEFNTYILNQVKASINPQVPLDIFHVPSQESPGLQAADLFAWGIFRKYEQGDLVWFDVFKGRISSEKVYGP